MSFQKPEEISTLMPELTLFNFLKQNGDVRSIYIFT